MHDDNITIFTKFATSHILFMKKIFPLLLAIYVTGAVTMLRAQTTPYRSSGNPHYWKNRKPHAAYWQQDVEYKIDATLNDTGDVIVGNMQLDYYNNSPDTLSEIYFHLYQNAYIKGSYADLLRIENGEGGRYNAYQKAQKGLEVESVTCNQTYTPTVTLDNTLMHVQLQQPLVPGGQLRFDIKFNSYFDPNGGQSRMAMFRVSQGQKHYNGVHWYPRVCVYDQKFGWDLAQHLGFEFYGDFGAYQVNLSLPNHYVLDATGVMLNEQEILPEGLRQKLDISNFKDKPLNSPASQIITPNGTYKTWKFSAINVHDFAFTADPTYRIGEVNYNNIRCIALAQEGVAARWQNAASYLAKIIEVHSREFGNYIYPKIIVADARSGMEYPMVTLDGGLDPNYRGLFVHEVGHNWYFGQVGNNETYRAMLDEGFTQFLTGWGLKQIDGDTAVRNPYPWYKEQFTDNYPVMYNSVMLSYLREAMKEQDGFINTHSHMFDYPTAPSAGYRQVYYKTATMLYNLQYVLGDDLFKKAMINYFEQWKVCHPYPEDFRNSIIQYTRVDLNWFFDQWMETDKIIDYKLGRIKKMKDNTYAITFHRKQRMQMPIDFTITDKSGQKHNYIIPNTVFAKKNGATVLPKWEGYDNLNPTHTAIVTVPQKLKSVEIDPSHRLADVNMLNNKSCAPIKLSFDSRVNNNPDWLNYRMYWRPDIWYNNVDGIKVGLHLNGNYFKYNHRFAASAWYNTNAGKFHVSENHTHQDGNELFNYTLTYDTYLNKVLKNSFFSFDGRKLDGLQYTHTAYHIQNRKRSSTFSIGFKTIYRKDATALSYLLYPGMWNYDYRNNTSRIGYLHNYNYTRGRGAITINLVSSSIGSDYNYSLIRSEVINENNLGKIEIRTRWFAQYGWGKEVAPESKLMLAGANNEELMENKYVRSQAFFPEEWTGTYNTGTKHFQYGGGLNLRGYNGYLAVSENSKGELINTYSGTSGTSASVEIELDKLMRFRPKLTRNWLHLDYYLFADAGIINYNEPDEALLFDKLRADAGAGIALTIKKFWQFENVKPFTIRFDMPFFLNTPPATESDFVKFRWLVGIGKSF